MPTADRPRVVVLTGASSGIGRATALAFARKGDQLVLAARGREGLESIADECQQIEGRQIDGQSGEAERPLVVPTDVTDPAAVKALFQSAIERHGSVDVWINNVGVGVVGLFDRTPLDAHRRVIEANLIGHMNGAHAVLPHFRSRGRGTLINMISLGGYTPTPYAAAYSASKFGLRGFSESLRAELADLPEVHVCEVYPTFVDTPGFEHGANYTGKVLAPPPLLLDAREVADALVSLSRRPQASLSLGGVGVLARLAHALAPRLTANLTYRLMSRGLKGAERARTTSGNLFAASTRHAIDGGHRTPSSLAVAVGALAVGGAVAFLGWKAVQAAQQRRSGG